MGNEKENVTPIPVKFKAPPSDSDEPHLKIVTGGGECNHKSVAVSDRRSLAVRFVDVQYLIREGETEVECGNCGTKLDPMFVIRHLATKETEWSMLRERYRSEMKRLSERKATKCRHCGRITPISRGKAK